MPLNCWALAAAALAVLPAALCLSTSLDTSVYEPLQLVGGPVRSPHVHFLSRFMSALCSLANRLPDICYTKTSVS